MKKRVYRITLMVVDHDEIGSDFVGQVLEATRYPNRGIAPDVISIETREVEWTDGHPLNIVKEFKAAFIALFAAGYRQCRACAGSGDDCAYCGGRRVIGPSDPADFDSKTWTAEDGAAVLLDVLGPSFDHRSEETIENDQRSVMATLAHARLAAIEEVAAYFRPTSTSDIGSEIRGHFMEKN